MCVCVCMKERQGETERQRQREYLCSCVFEGAGKLTHLCVYTSLVMFILLNGLPEIQALMYHVIELKHSVLNYKENTLCFDYDRNFAGQ